MRSLLTSIYTLLLCCLTISSIEAIDQKQIPIVPRKENHSSKREGTLALCGIFQNEAAYLREWIEYHRLVGVSHFYLYNNLSNDHYWEVLEPYVNSGVVELFEVPFDSRVYQDAAQTHNQVQVHCYNHAIRLARKANKWLAIIDSDEFICPVKDKSLLTVLKEYDYAKALMVYWQLYGTSSVWDIEPNSLLIEQLVNKFPTNYGENWLFKTIVQPKYAKCIDPHYCTVSKGKSVIPDHSSFNHKPTFTCPPVDVIRINHYTFRTESFYHNVKKARRAQWGYVPSPELEKERMDLGNSVTDPVMHRFVAPLKKKMFGL